MKSILIIPLVVFACGCAADRNDGGSLPLITIGQGTEDWLGHATLGTDPAGDGAPGGIDFGRLQAASQNGWLLLRFDVGLEIVLQRGNSLTLLIDGDGDSATGWQTGGMGADFSWVFGARNGYWHPPAGEPVPIDQTDFAIRAAPTFSGTEFELAIRLDAAFTDSVAVFTQTNCDIALWDQMAGGDRFPDRGALSVPVHPSSQIAVPLRSIARHEATHFRILQHNVLADGIVKRPEYFRRIYQAAEPDLLLLGEVFDSDPKEILALIEQWLPIRAQDQPWSVIGHQDGSAVISRYPIEMIKRNGPGTTDGFLLRLPAPWPANLLVVHGWAMCCDQDSLRQAHCDQIMANIRGLVQNGLIATNTPIILAGDFNLVTWRRQYQTLRDGAIVDTIAFGPRFAPDWGGGSLVDLNPRLLTQPMDYTWRDDSISFSPGRLDFIFYTGSRLGAGNNFVLDDDELPDSVRTTYGLNVGDCGRASDHLPVVADFYPKSEIGRR